MLDARDPIYGATGGRTRGKLTATRGHQAMSELSLPRTRRRFLHETGILAAGAALAWPQTSRAAARQVAANEKLAIGIIGAGGRGWDNLQGVNSQRIVAIADVDDQRCSEALKAYPKA